MKIQLHHFLLLPLLAMRTCTSLGAEETSVGVGAKPIPGAEVIVDGSRQMLDALWTYWEGPRFASSLPIKWKIVEDPVDKGTVVSSDDPAAVGGKYGAADSWVRWRSTRCDAQRPKNSSAASWRHTIT
jgi:hypothetical protein